jgi:hypothetical protein
MALLPEVHVNVGQLTFERIYQIFLPLIPGCTLVGGLMLAHPQSANTIALNLGLGRYFRIGVLLCCIYVVGLTLYGFSVVITSYCSILVGWFFGKIKIPFPKRQNEVPSKSTIWRRVAAEFLGTLTPLQAGPHLPAIAGNDVEWGDFYNVLQDYLLRGTPVLNNELLLLFTYLQATSWALMYLYWRTAMRGHWSVLVVSILIILFSATFPFGVNFFYWKYDRLTPWDFTARLINEIKMREKSKAPP